MNIISRSEAKALGFKFYFTGKPCKRGHVETRHTKKSECCVCRRELTRNGQKKYRAQHPDRVKAYQDNNKEKASDRGRKWQANNPEKFKLVQSRYHQRNKSDRLAANRAWKLANPEQAKALQSAGRANRRARETSSEGRVKKSDVHELFRLQLGLCAAPDCQVSLVSGFHLDHIIPISRHGTNNRDNLQLLCAPCNFSKRDKTMEEWADWKLKIADSRPSVKPEIGCHPCR